MRNYWWPGIIKNMKKYIDGCDMYQKMKNYIEALVGKLMVNEVSEKLWIYSMIDFITKLLLVARKDAILVVYDRLSKMIYFITMIEGTSVEGLV